MRSLVAFFLLLWLPLQAVAAVTMPFCAHAGHSHESAAAAMSDVEEHDIAFHRDRQGPLDSHHQHEPDSGSQVMNCNECGACHLACSPAAPATAVILAHTSLRQSYFLHTPARPALFVPEQRKRPPLAAIC